MSSDGFAHHCLAGSKVHAKCPGSSRERSGEVADEPGAGRGTRPSHWRAFSCRLLVLYQARGTVRMLSQNCLAGCYLLVTTGSLADVLQTVLCHASTAAGICLQRALARMNEAARALFSSCFSPSTLLLSQFVLPASFFCASLSSPVLLAFPGQSTCPNTLSPLCFSNLRAVTRFGQSPPPAVGAAQLRPPASPAFIAIRVRQQI